MLRMKETQQKCLRWRLRIAESDAAALLARRAAGESYRAIGRDIGVHGKTVKRTIEVWQARERERVAALQGAIDGPISTAWNRRSPILEAIRDGDVKIAKPRRSEGSAVGGWRSAVWERIRNRLLRLIGRRDLIPLPPGVSGKRIEVDMRPADSEGRDA
jgi:hypothetical protein